MGGCVEDPPDRKTAEEPGGSGLPDDSTLTAAPAPGGAGAGPPRRPSSGFSGRTLAHFEVLELVGAGGFGEVYRARDTKLDRVVAIKVLPKAFAVDAERRERFRREAIAASALNHPNICTVHELAEAEGYVLIVMELAEGQTLHERLKAGPLPVGEALPLAIQIADALGEAHRAGVLHRDVKCRNIALTRRGQVKVLDFGLAKLLSTGPRQEGQTLEKLTADGTSPGTPGYMSPEQLLAKPLDARSDLFSFGVVLYRMLTGRLPFEGTSAVALANAVLNAEPRGFGDAPIPEKLKGIVLKLLRKDAKERYASAEEVEAEVKALAEELAPGRSGGLSRNARIALVAVALTGILAGGWLWQRGSRQRRALEAGAEGTRLVEEQQYWKACSLLKEARAVLPKDPALGKLWLRATDEVSVDTDPPGADVSIRPWDTGPEREESVGQTPVVKARVPKGVSLLTIRKAGLAPVSFFHWPTVELKKVELRPEASVPAGMVPVVGGLVALGAPLLAAPRLTVGDFLIDRHEVTNEEYRRFVDAGGYEKPDFWKQPFSRDGRSLPWAEAIALFRDSTGRPGPATWELGSFPRGLATHPVTGVSWFEAAAYAEFAGKSLPTVYHWTQASQSRAASIIILGSNFEGGTTEPVGGAGTSSGFGTTDMAGNAKEWCWNETSAGKRAILGGGFEEPSYRFTSGDEQSPWERRPGFGFRCVKLLAAPPPGMTARIEPLVRDLGKEKPVSEETFNAFLGLYTYDRAELNARVEEQEVAEGWRREKVFFDAVYGGERVAVHLFLPRNAAPPFQPVVFFPGSNALVIEKFDPSFIEDGWDFVPKSGRALVFPIYKSTFERGDALKRSWMSREKPAEWRDHVLLWSKDLGRTLDYLETRKDIDSEKVGYLGFSWGGELAPVLLAVDPRFRAAILKSGGLRPWSHFPQVEPVNFVTRVKIPVLMLNDRYDNVFPAESSQLPLFRLLGTPEKDKKYVVYESGHGGMPLKAFVRETLAWLDTYLGPVKPKTGAVK